MAFAAGFGSGFAAFLAFSFTANSCFTLTATASVSTPYAWAAVRRTLPPSDCDLHSDCVRKCFLAAALLLLGLEAGIGLRYLLLGMVNGAGRLGANLPQFALLDAVRHDGLGSVLARFELGPSRLLRRVGLLLANFDVLVARDGLLAFRLLLVCRADLDKIGLGDNLRLYVRVQFRRIAIRVGALCGIWANRKSFLLARSRRAERLVKTDSFGIIGLN